MSEAELHFLTQRLYNGRLNKARRGEQFTTAPFGYVRSVTGNRIEPDPDEQVQLVVRLIFDKFDELGSVGALLLSDAARHQAGLPAQSWAGGRRAPVATGLQAYPHQDLAPSVLRGLLRIWVQACGPTSAKTRAARHRRCAGGEVQVGGDDPDAVPAYITWERHPGKPRAARRQSQPALNSRRAARRAVSVERRCVLRRCGRRMRVGYHAQGTPVYYICDSGAVEHAEPFCQSLAGNNLEAFVAEEVLRCSSQRGLSCMSRPLLTSSASDSGWTSTGSSGWNVHGSRPNRGSAVSRQ